ncbi:MAG TPA: AAA family ATPase [Rummeliibacillus sp.]|nr:AAA family ATPase [Rummeliibacillus sp.]
MALRGIQPELVKKRLKCLMYGVAGSGKTMAAISFPRPYLIDTEKGYEHEQYVDKIKENGGCVFHTTDFDDLLIEIKDLATEKHPYKTLIIDPLTVIYNNLVEKSASDRKSPQNPDGTAHGGHYIATDFKMKKLINLLLKLDMNVIITSHSKNLYGHNMAVLGQTFDCYKKLDYLFDLVFEIHKQGKFREALVKKSRLTTFPESDRFSFSYDEIAKRYGIEILEKDSQELLATQDQIFEVKSLIKMISFNQNLINKWFKKADATDWDEMPREAMDCIISYLKSKQITDISLSIHEVQHATV